MNTSTRGKSHREFQASLELMRHCKHQALVIFMAALAAMLPTSNVRAENPGRPLDLSCATVFAFNPTGAIDIQGTCHYSHLGLTTTSAVQIAIPQPDGSLHIVNTAVYTAANGDELFATFVGTGFFTVTGITFSGVETYTGGTGRFENASGGSTLAGSATFTAPTSGVGQFRGQGTLSY